MKNISKLAPLTLESFSAIGTIGRYLVGTIDGLFTLFLSIAYISWGGVLIHSTQTDHTNWPFVLGLFFMPILFVVIFLRHRIGTSITDNTPVIFCIISNTAVALAPLYIHFWR